MKAYKGRDSLYRLILAWEERSSGIEISGPSFRSMLDELLFHADLRFRDYIQYKDEGDFSVRLSRWLSNVPSDREKYTLLRAASSLLFVDVSQTESLYRDAYRRCIVPWLLTPPPSPDEHFSPTHKLTTLAKLRSARLFSITSSLNVDLFLRANDLSGLPKPTTLGENPAAITPAMVSLSRRQTRCVVLEDFVGTGKQAVKVLAALRRHVGPEVPILFVPLLMLEGAKARLSSLRRRGITLSPVLTIPRYHCVSSDGYPGEHELHAELRALVRRTEARVTARLDEFDDPPGNPFGYGSSGALVLTAHNVPNNTLPLVHHRAPDWTPLFRRIHHSKDGI